MCNMSTNLKEFTPVLKGKIELIKADIYNVKMKKIQIYTDKVNDHVEVCD